MRPVNRGLEDSFTSQLLRHRPSCSSSKAEGATLDEPCHPAQLLPSKS